MMNIMKIAESISDDFEKSKYTCERIKQNLGLVSAFGDPLDISDEQSETMNNFGFLLSYIIIKNPNIDSKSILDELVDEEKIINSIDLDKIIEIRELLLNKETISILKHNNYLVLFNFLNKYLNYSQMCDALLVTIGRGYTIRGLNEDSKLLFTRINKKLFYYAMDALKDYLKDLGTYVEKEKESFEKLYQKAIKISEVHIQMLENIKNNGTNPLLAIDQKGRGLFSERTLSYLFQLIVDNQTFVNDELDLKLLGQRNQNEKEKLNSILRKYHLSIDMFQNKDFITTYCDASSSLEILNSIKSMGINLDSIVNQGLDYILCSSTPEIANNIGRFQLSGYITTDFIISNISIFIDQNKYESFLSKGIQIPNSLYKRLLNNIQILKEYKIDISNPNYNPNILLMKTENLKQIGELARQYNISDLEVYNNPKLFDLIDVMIELGIDTKTIDFTNVNGYDINKITKRIVIAYSVGLEIIKNNRLIGAIVTGQNFLVDDCCLDNYIIDDGNEILSKNHKEYLSQSQRLSTDVDQSIIKEINDKFLYNSIYSFSGITVSSRKVLRNLKALLSNNEPFTEEMLVSAILYKSNLSLTDIGLIKETIKPFTYKK